MRRLLTLVVLRLLGWRVLPLGPGDTLVIQTEHPIPLERLARIAESVKAAHGAGVLFVPPGARVDRVLLAPSNVGRAQ
jgi:hypothetical protein